MSILKNYLKTNKKQPAKLSIVSGLQPDAGTITKKIIYGSFKN